MYRVVLTKKLNSVDNETWGNPCTSVKWRCMGFHFFPLISAVMSPSHGTVSSATVQTVVSGDISKYIVLRSMEKNQNAIVSSGKKPAMSRDRGLTDWLDCSTEAPWLYTYRRVIHLIPSTVQNRMQSSDSCENASIVWKFQNNLRHPSAQTNQPSN